MSIVKRLAMAAICGFVAHYFRPVLKRDFGGAWFFIACYAVGVVVAFPFVALIYVGLGGRDLDKLAAAYFSAYCAVGAGVVAGHYFMPDKEYLNVSSGS